MSAETELTKDYDAVEREVADADVDTMDELAKIFVTQASELKRIASAPKHTEESVKRFAALVEVYQEQPTLLDPLLESLVSPIMANLVALLRSDAPQCDVDLVCSAVYRVAKVRGHKVTTRFFPHEAADMEFVLSAASDAVFGSEQQQKNLCSWETKYVLLLWLSTLVLIPFDLRSVDRSSASEQSIESRLLNLGKSCLDDPGRSSEAAALLVARLVTRVDMVKTMLGGFVQWACETLKVAGEDRRLQMVMLGILGTVTMVFKAGHRTDLLPVLPALFDALQSLPEGNLGILGRKMRVKAIQRLGLTFLAPRVPTWRYDRGTRILLGTAKHGQQQQLSPQAVAEAEAETSDEIDIPEQCEAIFDALLNGLRDQDTVTRWSSAKGIGRLTGRLPLDMADEIVGSVLGMFAPTESDSAWHGGCLALAELARRGLLLPARLAEVVPLVTKALTYDEPRGAHSIGAHVRDAACYVCWAFARAYQATVMQPHVAAMAGQMMVTALFDREINCRRAAAAAFQESVGRQGNFPHGIDIITTADYFTLSNRQNAYTTVAPKIARYEEYRRTLIDHLVDVKTRHWDRAIRELAAKALGELCTLDTEDSVSRVVPSLIPRTQSNDPTARHGALAALSEVLDGLFGAGVRIPEKLAEALAEIIPAMQDARLFRGKCVELVRAAACRLVGSIARSHIPLKRKKVGDSADDHQQEQPPQPQPRSAAQHKPGIGIGVRAAARPRIAVIQEVLDECFQVPSELVQAAASTAYRVFSGEYYVSGDTVSAPNTVEKLVAKYCKQVTSDRNPAVRRGYALAIGQLPRAVAVAHCDRLLAALAEAAAVPKDPEMRDPETRRNAVSSLTSLCCTVAGAITPTQVDVALGCLVIGMADFSTDSRGDVGSWVREASLFGVRSLCTSLSSCSSDLLTPERCVIIVRETIGQLGQKIDKMRSVAGQCLSSILDTLSRLPEVEVGTVVHTDALLAIVKQAGPMWYSDSRQSFWVLCQMLAFPEYRESALCGIAPTIGGLSRDLAAQASAALCGHLSTTTKDDLAHFATFFPDVVERNLRVPRIGPKLIVTASELLKDGTLARLEVTERDAFAAAMCSLATRDVTRTRDLQKLHGAMQLFCDACRSADNGVAECALRPLVGLLAHPYPKVRKNVSENLFSVIAAASSHGRIDPVILDVLSSTPWDKEDTAVWKPHHDRIVHVLSLSSVPSFTVPPEPAKPGSSAQGFAYSDLVREVGGGL